MTWIYDYNIGIDEKDYKKYDFVKGQVKFLFINKIMAHRTGFHERWYDDKNSYELSLVEFNGVDWLIMETTNRTRNRYTVSYWHSSRTSERDTGLAEKISEVIKQAEREYEERNRPKQLEVSTQ